MSNKPTTSAALFTVPRRWRPYGAVPKGSVCGDCGQTFPCDDLVRFFVSRGYSTHLGGVGDRLIFEVTYD